MKTRRNSLLTSVLIQAAVLAVFAGSYAASSSSTQSRLQHRLINSRLDVPVVRIERQTPLMISPLYDDPSVVSDEELAAVLKQVLPRFDAAQRKPNYIEHALRTWRIDAEFQDPGVMSGAEMKDFLVDHGKYLASWGQEVEPLLVERPQGVAIRWGSEEGASVHHDHWLACLTEAGVTLDEPVFTPSRRDMTINDVIQEALRDLRLDERETEWSAMAFGLWLPPAKHWQSNDGRQMSFDMLAERLIRGHQRFGVCSGTHRVYSLMSLWRLDEEFQILSPDVRDRAYAHLEHVRDLIKVTQFEDGHWPSNWSDGESALKSPIDDPLYKQVIATGHHLEWLAIAPKELHPPHDMIQKAADWIIAQTTSQTEEQIRQTYTFYSHVGNALALWRNTRPPDFWKKWEETHPYVPGEQQAGDENTAEPTDADEPAENKTDTDAQNADAGE